mgnify:CR=1 FL=1
MLARLGAVDCTEDDKELCGKYGVKGFPTIQVFGADKKSPTKYESGRDADSIEAFGFTNPVLIDAGGTVAAGHGRVRAASGVADCLTYVTTPE